MAAPDHPGRDRPRPEPTQPPAATRSAPTPTAAQLSTAAATFDLLSAPLRLHLVWLLLDQHRDVSTLARLVDAPVAAVSHHLARLRLAGVVTVHRHGRHHRYTVDDPHMIAVVTDIAEHIHPDGTLATYHPTPS